MSGIIFGCVVPHPPVIVPDVGRGQERVISSTISAMEHLAALLKTQNVDTALIISPHGKYLHDSMGVLTAQSSVGDLSQWGSRDPRVEYQNDLEMVKAIQQETERDNIPLKSIGAAHYGLDHGVMVPLHFLNEALNGASLVPLTFSWLSLDTHYSFGKAIRRAADKNGKRIAIIASGDMSHRLIPQAPAGYDPMGKMFDEKMAQAVAAMDSKLLLNLDADMIERAGECGLRPVIIVMGAMEGLDVKANVISYEGPFGVGYLVASLEVADC